MQGFQLSTHAALCLLVVLSSTMICTGVRMDIGIMVGEGGTTTEADLSVMEATCEQYFGAGYIGNPGNCSSWGYCSGNQLIEVGSCGRTFRYNIKTGVCVDPSEFDCINSATATCQYKTSPTYVADPNDCTEYVRCDGKGRYQSGFGSGLNYYFGVTQQTYIMENTCPTNNMCRLARNGIYLADLEKCGKWTKCMNGKVYKPDSSTNQQY